MKILTGKEIKVITGKNFLSDEDVELSGKLIYLSGITGFDELLEEKHQYESEYVVHFIKYKKGILIRLAKFFKHYETAISLNEIEKIIIDNRSNWSVIQIKTKNDTINFAFKNENLNTVQKFFEYSKLPVNEQNIRDISTSTTEEISTYFKKRESISINSYQKIALITILCGVISFFASYFIFGTIGGEQLSLGMIFNNNKDFIDKMIDFSVIEPIRQKILITTFSGIAFGLLLSLIIEKRKK